MTTDKKVSVSVFICVHRFSSVAIFFSCCLATCDVRRNHLCALCVSVSSARSCGVIRAEGTETQRAQRKMRKWLLSEGVWVAGTASAGPIRVIRGQKTFAPRAKINGLWHSAVSGRNRKRATPGIAKTQWREGAKNMPSNCVFFEAVHGFVSIRVNSCRFVFPFFPRRARPRQFSSGFSNMP